MSGPSKQAWSVVGALALVVALALIHDGGSIYQVALILVLVIGIVMGSYFLASRIASAGQSVHSHEQSTPAKSNGRITVFGILAGATLLISLQQLFTPVQSEDRTLGIAGVIMALFFGFLSFRAYREMKIKQIATEDSIAEPNPAPRTGLGNPKAILLGITIFGVLFIAGSVRRIVTPARSNDIWIGIGQVVIWLPILTYFAYREYRRMKN